MSAKNKEKNKKPNARASTEAVAFKRDEGKKYKALRKIPLSLLLAFTAPLTVCFFGPFETYCGNMDEFLFSLGDFFPLCIAAAVAMAVVVFSVLMILNGRAYDIATALISWCSIMTFLQRHYLNFGVNSLAGDGVGEAEAPIVAVALTSLLWAVTGVASVFAAIWFKKKNIAHFFVSCAVVLVVILATQAIGFVSLSLTTDVYVPVTDRADNESDTGEPSDANQPSVLTYANLNKLSGKKNVVVFVIDRFDVRYFENLQKTNPEFLEGLDGFTFYNDYTSLYCRTYPAIASILTDRDNNFDKTRLDYFKEIYTDGGPMRKLHGESYDVNVYTEKYYAYDDANYMKDYVGNISGTSGYEIVAGEFLSIDMLRLSLGTCLPLPLKDAVGSLSTPDFNEHAVYLSDEPLYDADMKNVYDYITKGDFKKTDSEGQLSFIHIFGCHTPVVYDEEWNEIPKGDKKQSDTTMALRQSLTIIYEYIEEMKRLGVYEDATIVITGDHPAALSDSKLIGEAGKSDNGTRVTAMLFKKAGDAGTALKTSTAQISQDELWNTIYESEGLTHLKDGQSFFDISEGEDRVRRYLFEKSVTLEDGSKADEIVEYKITGTARNRENWKVEKVTVIGKIYK